MSQKILNGDEIRIGVQELGGHGVSQVMTGELEGHLGRIALHPLLDAPDGYGLTPIGLLLRQKQMLCPRLGPDPEIGNEGIMGIIADIDDPALAALPVVDENPSARELYGITGELCHLLHPEPTAEHEGEDCPISGAFYDLREPGNLLIAQVPRQRFCEPQGIASFYGIGDGYPLLSSQILIEPSDAVQVAVDGLGPEPPV